MAYRGVVFGWYHQRNAGDDRIAHCIERWLGDHELIFLPHMESPPMDVLRRCDYALLGGGSIANQASGVFAGMQKWIRAARMPVFGVGLGISYYPELREELRVVSESGGCIWLRDQKSADFLGFEQTFVAPDITWLYPHTFAPSLSLTREPGLMGVNFRPWPKRQWSMQSWAEVLNRFEGRAESWPLCFGKERDENVLREVLPGQSETFEFDPTLPHRAELIVAMRFHAIIFSIQARTPFVALGNTHKLGCLLGQVGLEQACVQVEEPEKFTETLDYVRANISAERLSHITCSQSQKAWQAANLMKDRIETAAEQGRRQRSRLPSRVRRRLDCLMP